MQGSSPRLTPTGHLVFLRPTSLWAAPIDLDTFEVPVEAVPVLDGVSSPLNGYGVFDLAGDGTLIYRRRTDNASPLVEVDRNGRTVRLIGEGFRGAHHGPLRFSPDGGSVAVCRHPVGGIDQVVIHDLRRGTVTPLGGPGDSRNPVWTPDGTRLTFGSTRAGTRDIFEVALTGGAEPQPLLVRPGEQFPSSWSPDGQVLAFTDGSLDNRDIWLLPRGGEPFALLASSTVNEDDAAFSPDGRFLASVSNESGRNEVYVQEYPTPGRRIRISTGGGGVPVWAPRSDGLYYLSLERDVFYAPITVEPELGGGTPQLMLEHAVSGIVPGFDIAPDGQSFVTMKDAETAAGSLDLIVNWFEELKRLVPTE